MTIKVGDMVRIVADTSGTINSVGDEGVVTEVSDCDARVQVDGMGTSANWSRFEDLELITPATTTPTILTTITDRMEQHMAAGQYVQAVKWAQVAEVVKELEDE